MNTSDINRIEYKQLKKILYLSCAVFLLWGCDMTQKKSEKPKSPVSGIAKETNDSVVPKGLSEIEGYDRRVISLTSRTNESQFKLEITTGITMEVDACNLYGLQGNFEQDIDRETGTFCYIFKSNGDVIHTDMGCPNDSMYMKFVAGQTILVDYNSSEPTIVYLPKKIELKLTVWKTSEMTRIPKNPEDELLKTFPKSYYKNHYDGYVIQLPELSREAKIELIPGITKLVDCNNHWLTTKGFGRGETIEFAWRYYSYDSGGEISSTHKSCPNDQLTEKFIHSISPITLPVEKDVPIVLFIPKGFELRYRIWEMPDIIFHNYPLY